jgi:hypothetical protein
MDDIDKIIKLYKNNQYNLPVQLTKNERYDGLELCGVVTNVEDRYYKVTEIRTPSRLLLKIKKITNEY